MHSLTIVIPTYNEVANVEALLTGLAHAAASNADIAFSATIVDDSSPDGTADLARSLAPTFESDNFHVDVLVREEKQGLGAAYIWAFTHILSGPDRPDYILQMDADLSHDPKYVSGFAHQIRQGADFVVASRYIPGGGTPDWAWNRKLLSRGGNLYSRALLGSRITDYTGGFNMFRSDLLEKLNVQTVSSTGYGFIIVLKYRALRAAKKIAQIPIVFLDREHGSSKIPSNTLINNLILVLEMRFAGKHR